MRRKEYQKALADLEHAIELDPAYAAAYFTRACVHTALQYHDRAASDYAMARQLAPRKVPDLVGEVRLDQVACKSLIESVRR